VAIQKGQVSSKSQAPNIKQGPNGKTANSKPGEQSGVSLRLIRKDEKPRTRTMAASCLEFVFLRFGSCLRFGAYLSFGACYLVLAWTLELVIWLFLLECHRHGQAPG
jgi:hypothetical protein